MNQVTIQRIADSFMDDLTHSAHGKKTSLAFIKNTIPSSPLVQNKETFQVMAVGGTFFRNAQVRKTSTHLKILSIEEKTLPRFVTKDDLFVFLADNLMENTQQLALNFAYAVEPVFSNNKLEGILLGGAKEHTFTGLLGKNICQGFEEYVAETKHRTISVSLANDTICLLLSGLTQQANTNLGAGIVGTGINFAFFLDDNTLINLEAGSFNNFPQSPIGKYIDDHSAMPKDHVFEKEISGSYLYQHFNIALEQQHAAFTPITNTAQLDEIARDKHHPYTTLANELLNYSASLTAAVVTAITCFKNHSMHFVMQGSLFWKGYKYKETVAKIVRETCPDYPVEFIYVGDADILGAAKLAA